MSEVSFVAFQREILKLGFLPQDHDTLWTIARRCARQTGLPLAGMGAVGTAALGPGAALGFLAGLATGTASCTAVTASMRTEMQKLIIEERKR